VDRLFRRLLSGASLATLQLCTAGAARASAPIVVVTTSHAPIHVTALQNPDYIQVGVFETTPSYLFQPGRVLGDITNSGTIGLASVGIEVVSGGVVTGSIVNAGVISATQAGISAHGELDGGVINAEGGKIVVSGASSILGLLDSEATGGTISNAGTLLVTATGAVGNHANKATGIYEIAYRANQIATVENSGEVQVSAISDLTGDVWNAADAAGIVLDDVNGAAGTTTSYSIVNVTNKGGLSVKAQATNHALSGTGGGGAFAAAVGIDDYLRDFTAATDTITNSGTLRVAAHAAATATSGGQDLRLGANATGIVQTLDGKVFGYQGSAKASLSNSGGIAVSATAIAKGGASLAHNATVRASALYQSVSDVETAIAALSNSGTIDIHAKFDTAYSGDTEDLQIGERAIGQSIRSEQSAVASFVNSAQIAVDVESAFIAGGSQDYDGFSAGGFAQSVSGGQSATALFVNKGALSITGSDKIVAGANVERAAGSWNGIVQSGNGNSVSLSLLNAGNIAMQAAVAVTAGTDVSLAGNVIGLNQQGVMGSQASSGVARMFSGHVENSGNLSLSLQETVNAAAIAAAGRVMGIEQAASHFAFDESLDNSGTIDVAAIVDAISRGNGSINGGATGVRANATGIEVSGAGSNYQLLQNSVPVSTPYAIADDPAPLHLDVSNSGSVSVDAVANGARPIALARGLLAEVISQTWRSHASHSASGVRVGTSIYRVGGGRVSGVIDNSGTLVIAASAPGGRAEGDGIAVIGGNVDVTVTNESPIVVTAAGASVKAQGLSFAGYRTQGLYKITNVTTGNSNRFTDISRVTSNGAAPAAALKGVITNSGDLDVRATGSVKAEAEGIALNGEEVDATVSNEANIAVSAAGPSSAAFGIRVFGSATGVAHVKHITRSIIQTGTSSYQHITSSSLQTGTYARPETTHIFGGKIDNSGTLEVSASNGRAVGIDVEAITVAGSVRNSGTITVSATGGAATGVRIDSTTYDGAFVNAGKIFAEASGTGASAEGVEIDASTVGSNASFLNNGGTISATVNGLRGTAIDASGPVMLELDGGSITGNIVENTPGAAITIGSGNLSFDGVINQSKVRLGSLTVGANGTLTLAANATEGAASAYVKTYVQNGTLAISGSASGNAGAIHAANATLSGAVVLDVVPGAQPYSPETTYKVVFSDAPLSGTWSSVSVNLAPTFFSASGAYTANEADITLVRATFDSINGLTGNERAVGAAIEAIYDISGASGPLGKLLGDLFNLTPDQYADALESLSGIPAGELSAANQATAQSFLDAINNHLADMTGDDADVAALMATSETLAANVAPSNVSLAQANNLSGTHVWGGGFQSGNSVDRTASGPAYSSHQSGLLAGVDLPVSRDLLFGVAASWSTGDIKTEKMLGFGTFRALQIAGYARYTADNGVYALGDLSYGDFTNKLNRFISIPGFGAGNLHGAFNSNAWGLYGEAGWKFEPSEWAMSLTPYAAVSYLDAKSDGYTESGFGAPLIVGISLSRAASTYLGLKLSKDWEAGAAMITPRLTAAWQHDFTKNAWGMRAAFAAVPTAGFGLNGSALARDGAFLDGGITLHIADQVNVLLDYQSRFTSDRTDNAFMARANIRF